MTPDEKRRPAWEPDGAPDPAERLINTQDNTDIEPESAVIAWRRQRWATKPAAGEVSS